MKIFFAAVALSLGAASGASLAIDLIKSDNKTDSVIAPPAISASNKPRTSSGNTGPVVGGMLEDGREVPARFRDKKPRSQNNAKNAEENDESDSTNK